MVITESQMGTKLNPLALLEKMDYLTEAESQYVPAMVPIVENSSLGEGAHVVRLEDMVSFSEANGIEDLGYALAAVCEASEVSPSSIVFSVQEDHLYADDDLAQLASDIMNEGVAIVGTCLPSSDPFNFLAEAAIVHDMINEDAESLLEAYVNDEYEKFFMSEAAVEAMVYVNEEATPASQGDAEGLVAKMKKYASAAPEAISKKIASLNEKLRAMEKAEQDKGADRGVLSKMKEKIIAAVRYLTDLLKKKKSEAAAPAQA